MMSLHPDPVGRNAPSLAGDLAVKTRQVVPHLDGNDVEREALEARHATALEGAFRKIIRALVPPGTTAESLADQGAVARTFTASLQPLYDACYTMLRDAAMFGASIGLEQVEALQIAPAKADIVIADLTDWSMVNDDVVAWLTNPNANYTRQLVESIGQNSASQVYRLVNAWVQDGRPLNALVADLETMPFSPQRARLIATTEVTRAFAQGKNIAWRRTGVVERRRWHTGNDELVCEVCQRLDGREVGLDEPFDDVGRIMYPPAHPRCRCTVQPVIPVSSPVSTDYTSPGLRDPVITFSNRRNQDDDRLSLSGIPFRQAPAAAWGKIPDRALPSEPYDLPPLTPTARRRGVGVLVVEEDGRVWVVKTDDDDMYEIPTVAVPKGLTLQQTALWHAYQATGLIVDLVDYVVDSPVDGIVTRYYVAKRRAGAPWGARSKRWVSLATTRHAASYANRMADRNILRQF